MFRNIMISFIPKWYKEKYKDRLCNRKHASGYWFDFIKPRIISPKKINKKFNLYRWLNFYFEMNK